MSRDLAVLFAGVTLLVTIILIFQSLGVPENIKTLLGKFLDMIPKGVYAIVGVVCACLALYYVTTQMVKSHATPLGLVFLLVLFGCAMLDIFLSGSFIGGRL